MQLPRLFAAVLGWHWATQLHRRNRSAAWDVRRWTQGWYRLL